MHWETFFVSHLCAISLRSACFLYYFSVPWDYRASAYGPLVFSSLSLTVRYGGSTRRSNARSKPRNGTREGAGCASAAIPFIDVHVCASVSVGCPGDSRVYVMYMYDVVIAALFHDASPVSDN